MAKPGLSHNRLGAYGRDPQGLPIVTGMEALALLERLHRIRRQLLRL